VRASLLGASLTVPFTDKKLTLGTWQQIIMVDFDKPSEKQDGCGAGDGRIDFPSLTLDFRSA